MSTSAWESSRRSSTSPDAPPRRGRQRWRRLRGLPRRNPATAWSAGFGVSGPCTRGEPCRRRHTGMAGRDPDAQRAGPMTNSSGGSSSTASPSMPACTGAGRGHPEMRRGPRLARALAGARRDRGRRCRASRCRASAACRAHAGDRASRDCSTRARRRGCDARGRGRPRGCSSAAARTRPEHLRCRLQQRPHLRVAVGRLR